MCEDAEGCGRAADLHAFDLIGLPGVHRDGSHEADGDASGARCGDDGKVPDMDAEASVHAGALETEEDGEADWRDEGGSGWGGRAYLRPIGDSGLRSLHRGCWSVRGRGAASLRLAWRGGRGGV